jgi:hypothetical protein
MEVSVLHTPASFTPRESAPLCVLIEDLVDIGPLWIQQRRENRVTLIGIEPRFLNRSTSS